MKPFRLSALGFACVFLIFFASITYSLQGQIPGDQTQVVWEDDFSDPSKWIVYNESSPPVDWEIINNVDVSPVVSLDPIQLPSADNGFAFINGDAQGGGSVQDSWIEYTDPIDLSDADNATFIFHQVSRNFETQYFVQVSADGGQTWTSIEVNEDLLDNTNTSNPEVTSVDISAIADGASDVRIRFRYLANWGWFWAVDDLSIVEENDCTIDLDLGPDVVSSCGEEPVILDAGEGFDTYLWSTGATSQTLSVTESGSYSVTVGLADCGPAAQTFYSEDFSNGFDGQGNNGAWSFEGDQGDLWFITFPLGAPNGYDPQAPLTTTSAYGSFIPNFNNTLTTIPSNSANNGFVMIDTDRFNSTALFPSQQGSSSFTTNEVDAILVSPSIDLTGVESAVLTFWQQWRMCCSNYDLRVEVSVTGGALWNTYDLFDLNGGTGNVPVSSEFSIDITDLIQSTTDLSDCRIRFIWDRAVSLDGESSLATHYYFMLDDVRITEPIPDVNLTATDSVFVDILDISIDQEDTEILLGEEIDLSVSVNAISSIEDLNTPIDGFTSIGCLDDHCYYLSEFNVDSWGEADSLANAQGGYLATLTSAEENDLISSAIEPSESAYIGLFQNTSSPDYSEPDGGWEWITGEPLEYTNWADGEPDELVPGENSALIFNLSEAGWYDVEDIVISRFILEKDLTTFLWSTGDTTETITVNPTETTTYTVTVSNGITTCTDTVTISVCGVATVDLGPDTLAACGVEEFELDAGPGFDQYTWSTGETTQSIVVDSTGWYSVTVGVTNCNDTTSNDPDIFWSEDFSNGLDGQGDNGAWTRDGEQGELWFITFPLGAPNGYSSFQPLPVDAGYSNKLPLFADDISTIPSPTASNGFVMLDADRYNSTRTSDNPSYGVATFDPIEAFLESPVIDLTGVDSAILTFRQQWRLCCSDANIAVEFSTDGGFTWITEDLFALSGGSMNEVVSGEVEINLTTILEGSSDLSNCKIRFNWDPQNFGSFDDPTHYYCMFDDIRITSVADEFDLTVTDSVFVNFLNPEIAASADTVDSGEEVVLNALINGSEEISDRVPDIGFYNKSGELNGHVYYVSQSSFSWDEANDIANAFGGYLATITSPEENAFIDSIVEPFFGPQFYLGLRQNFDSPDYSEPAGGWEWTNGEPLNYVNWASTQPDDAFDDDVAVFNKDLGAWTDQNGVFGRSSIIEKNVVSYLWSTGDTTASLSVNPEQTTTYTLTVSDGILSCTDSITITVTDVCNVDGGELTATFGPKAFCLGNGQENVIDASVTGNSGMGRFGLIDANTFDILGGNSSGTFNLNQYPAGDYLVGYVSFDEPGFFVGVENVGDLEGCFDFSNLISFSTYELDGGFIGAEGPSVVCVGDGIPSSLSFFLYGAEGPNFRWALLTEDFSQVVKSNQSGTFFMENVPSGSYRVVHAAYGNDINITQVDPQNVEGCIDLSNIVSVLVLDCSPASLKVSPNPASDFSTATFTAGAQGQASLELYDLNGRLVRSVYQGFAEGEVEYRFDTDVRGLPDGVYVYRLTTSQGVIQEKVIISR